MKIVNNQLNPYGGFIAVTTCTGRKRLTIQENLFASYLDHGTLSSVLTEWCRRIKLSGHRTAASRVYCGRSFQEALSAARQSGNPLWIISAGIGLVNEKLPIPAYDLTISGNNENNIKNRIIGGHFDLSAWWEGVNSSFNRPSPIKALLKKNKRKLVLFALSHSYAKMIEKELMGLSSSELARIRMMGLSLQTVLDKRLHANIMPYDMRFDGPDSTNPGTRSDFAQRAMHHFTKEIIPEVPDNLDKQKQLVSTIMNGSRFPIVPKRKKTGDKDIITLIISYLKSSNWSPTRLLRVMREEEKIACEQKRFHKLYTIAKESAR